MLFFVKNTKGSSLFAALLFFFLSACRPHIKLACRSEYLYPSYLASVQINTPDPNGACFFGQQLIISWRIPKECFTVPVNLILKVRFGSREVDTVVFPIPIMKGTYVYRLVNKDYWGRGGVVSFQATLENQEGEVLDTWKHFLWANIIEIRPEE